jgi:hypothetical protein
VLLLFNLYSDLDHGSLGPRVRRCADKPKTAALKREPLAIERTIQAELRQYFGFSASGTSFAGGPFEQLIGDLYHFDRHAFSCVEGLARSGLFKKRAARGGSSCGALGVADDGGG